MAKLTREDVLKLARLSKLELSEEQLAHFTPELESILEHIEQLQSVDVSGLEPTNQVTGLTNVMRADEVREYASGEQLLKNLPDHLANQIKVKRVIN